MITRECPNCGRIFKRCKMKGKVRTCSSCQVELYYDGGSTVLLSIRRAEIKAADDVVGVLERHISKRDGLNFRFQGAERAKERHLAYGFIERAEKYLSYQIDIGVTAVEFCIEMIEHALSDSFWGRVVQSLAMLLKHIARFAKDVFMKHRDDIFARERDDELSSLSHFMSFGEDKPCLRPAST